MINLLLRAAPRACLRNLELGALPPTDPRTTHHAVRLFRDMNIALVKQEVLAAIPNLPGRHRVRDFLKSAGGHTGCLSLLHELGAQLILVREDFSPECQTWKEKVSFDPNPGDLVGLYRKQTLEITYDTPAGPRTRHDLAVSARDVDWGKFDLVVCLDIPVPEKIVRAHPRTVWAYMITETAMPSYRASRRTPLFGYDLFLNQKCRLHSVRPSNRWHEIDFPWAFQTPDCYTEFPKLGPEKIFFDPKDSHTSFLSVWGQNHGLPLQPRHNLSPVDWVQALRQSRYLVRLTGQRNWGNLLIEAACLGALVLADPVYLENPAPLLQELVVKNQKDVIDRLELLERDPDRRSQLQKRQHDRVQELAFARPLRKLGEKVAAIRKKRMP